MNSKSGICILLSLLFFTACSASKKAYKKAQEFEDVGLYVEAAEYDLKALHEKPDFKEAQVHLKKVAPLAYDELLSRVQNLESAEKWDETVAEFEALDRFTRDCHRFGVVLKTINIKERLKNARSQAAEGHFTRAESLYAKQSYQRAARAYLKASHFIDNYNNSHSKAILSFLKAGDEIFAEKRYRQAIAIYKNILEFAPRHSKTLNKIAECHFQLGRQYFNAAKYREALKQFETTQKYVEDYRDAAEWAQRAYDEAVQVVGIFPFQNLTAHTVDGYLIASEVINRAIHANLRFAEFLNEAEMNELVNILRRKRPDKLLEVEILKLASDEGLDAVVWGKVQEVRVKDYPESFKEFEHEKVVVVEDSSGKEVEEKTPIYYREYSRARQIRLSVDYFILEAATGKYLDRNRFVEQVRDEVQWIAYQGSIYDLPKNKRPLLDARRDPQPVQALLNELLVKIGQKISREVIKYYR
ncbi:MAG: hypothetical protein ACE5HS_11655 [bacterium]